MKPTFITLSSFLVILLLTLSSKAAAAVPGQPGCLQTQYYLGILKIYALDSPIEAAERIREMNWVRMQACSGSYTENETIRYKNGQTATSYAGREDATWYWPNGRNLTSYATRADATFYYPNGQTMTSYFLRTDATYYYSNGKTLSSYIGRKGATLYLKDGSSVSSPGFEINGQLDFIGMADYVDAINAGSSLSPKCDTSTMKAELKRAIQMIQDNQGHRAIEVLSRLQGCL